MGANHNRQTPVRRNALRANGEAVCSAYQYLKGNYEWKMPELNRKLGQVSQGNRIRLLSALQRFEEGANLTVAIIGGSIAAGQGAVDAPAFPGWLQRILDITLPDAPGRVVVHNGAVPGTVSQYMSVCHNVHVPKHADIVFMEYAVNDEELPYPHMNNQIRRPYEKLIRQVLKYPNKPAVVLMHAYRWFFLPPLESGTYWASAERQQSEFAWYYGLPSLSIKACCWHLMAAGVEGYQVHRPRADKHGHPELGEDVNLKGKVFFYDVIHPDGNTGHRAMAELAAQYIMDAYAQVATGYKVPAAELQTLEQPLPKPMLPGNMESASDRCFIGPNFQNSVTFNSGFQWVNEGKRPDFPKWGFVSETPGHFIRLKIDTTSSTNDTSQVGSPMLVELGFLKSYERMGQAMVMCEGSCRCNPFLLDGHHSEHTSQTFLQSFHASQSPDCIVKVEVLNGTASGHHKVKLTGIMVSEETGTTGFQNSAAWDWINTAASKSSDGVFDIKNVVRRQLGEHMQRASAQLQREYHARLRL